MVKFKTLKKRPALRSLSSAMLLLIGAIASGARAGSLSDAQLEQHSVRVLRALPRDIAQVGASGNAGILIGKGLILTAAHVIGNAATGALVYVVAGDRIIEAHVAKAGDYNKVDVSLLEIDPVFLPEPMQSIRPLALCDGAPLLDQPVRVAEHGHVSGSVIVSPEVLPPGVSWQFDSLIRDVYTTGNSGSGVFDDRSGCLMGIMSRKIERTVVTPSGERQVQGVAKYFVPASQIKRLIGEMLPSG